MNREYLHKMSLTDLDIYAGTMGIDVSKAKTATAKCAIIENAYEHVAKIDALGMVITIPIKRAHDRAIIEKVPNANTNDKEAFEFLRELVGDEQYAEIEKACTDEDGTFDTAAFATAYALIMNSEKLKNFSSSQPTKAKKASTSKK